MNKVAIYYFSGTGNSLVVARDIAGKMNANLIPVISMIDQESINTDASVIGIVFPIYDFKPPLIIRKFVGKLENISSKYIFNIELVANKPSWSSHCAGCFACFHWCPKEAIQLGNMNLNLKKYHHPDIKISDMMKQN
jgi:flavodoxin